MLRCKHGSGAFANAALSFFDGRIRGRRPTNENLQFQITQQMHIVSHADVLFAGQAGEEDSRDGSDRRECNLGYRLYILEETRGSVIYEFASFHSASDYSFLSHRSCRRKCRYFAGNCHEADERRLQGAFS
jgi:hypothetical protein